MILSTVAGYTASVNLGQIELSYDTQYVTFGSATDVQLVERESDVLLYWLTPAGELIFGKINSDLSIGNQISLVASGVSSFYAKYLPGVGNAFAYVVGTTLTINVAGTTTIGTWDASRLHDFSFDVNNDLTSISVLYRAGDPAQAYIETYSAQIKAEAPVFVPDSGTYSTAINVVLSTNTPNAVIHYTTDGSVPSDSSPTYTGAIPVSGSQMIRAITTAPGYINSDESSATYTLILTPRAVAPVFSPVAGTYTTALAVAITSTTPNRIIRYTLDGTDPTTSSPIYYGPISVTSDVTIKAFATAAGYLPSTVSSAMYEINIPEPTPEDHVSPVYSYLNVYDFKMGLRLVPGFLVDNNV